MTKKRMESVAKYLIARGIPEAMITKEYEADKRKRLGEEGAKPKRIRYKPISR